MQLFLASLTYGQADSIQNTIVNNRFIIRIAPLALIDVYNSSNYKFGFEVQPFHRFAITGDFGGYFKTFNLWKNCTGFNIDIGFRYYLNRHRLNQRFYIALNYFYKEQGFDHDDSIIDVPFTYRTEKFVTCSNVNFGWVKIYKKRLVLDLFAGLGIRIKKVNSTVTHEELDKAKEYSDSQSLFFIVTPGKFIYPNLNIGMRIGLRII